MLTAADQRALFALAREAIRAHLRGEPPPPLPEGSPALRERLGVFVTLRMRADGALRGCIGHTVAQEPLAAAVRSLAVSAAFRDHRFPPLRASELPLLELELTVLSTLSVADPARIEVGTHGLLVRLGSRSGLLLPQVASERGWTPEEFLRHTCRKAGLPDDAWQDPDAELLWFTGSCYEERDVVA